MTEFNDFGRGAILFDIQRQDRIKYVIRRKALIIALIGTKFGRRWFGEHRFGDDFATSTLIDIATQTKHVGLQQIFNDCVATNRIAVNREVTNCKLALVASCQNHPTELVRQRHQDLSATTALQVFFREVGRLTFKAWSKH